jgi:two-component system OmpR family response regulator
MRRLLAMPPLDLVLLDVMLPVQSGFKLCRDLRTEGQVQVIVPHGLAETSTGSLT